MENIDEQVDQLLHDAEHAEAGRDFAKRLGHSIAEAKFSSKAQALRAEAERIDPNHTAAAWTA